jgi:hypothetical protein
LNSSDLNDSPNCSLAAPMSSGLLTICSRVCLTAHEGSHIINEAMTTIAW